jgi:ABC-2 type transport system ATP-binding protein
MDVIQIDALGKRFGDLTAVADVSLSVAEGEAFGYLGPNGAGKTTTIRCMLGLISPSAGSIRILGHDVRTELPAVLAEVGYLPGEFGLWNSMTGREVLDYLGRLHPRAPAKRADLCDRFGLGGTDLDREVRFYSRGMKQKIGIVQAFQHDPTLIILDEPTEGLDPVMKDRFVHLLREQTSDGRTIFMSSHILSEVETATDRVGIVKEGRLVRVGNADDFSGERVRHCSLTLKEPSSSRLLNLPGVSDLAVRDDLHYRFEYRGDMEPLIKRLARAKVLEFIAEPESLAEAFFEVYQES